APFACMRIRSIYEYFPGCRVIYTLRNPLTSVPSMLDVARKYWETTSGLHNWEAHQGWLYQTIREMYRYPLSCMGTLDPATCQVVVHDDLLTKPRDTIRAFLQKFGYNVSPAFDEMLKAEDVKQRQFRSKHQTNLEQFNLTREQVMADFGDVFARYTFGAPAVLVNEERD
ncbi:MAG TPA: sulfotransferase, partial [Kiritimatiellia bacterium]